MKTIFDASARVELVARLGRLTSDGRPRWGNFTAPKMLVHVNDALRMASGELAVAAKPTPLKNAVVRWLVIHSPMPWPKGVPTAPELLARGNANAVQFEAERAAFTVAVSALVGRKGAARWPDHPAFGPMREKDWGALGYRHVDHHFRQFGI